jgi:hypothetical protein
MLRVLIIVSIIKQLNIIYVIINEDINDIYTQLYEVGTFDTCMLLLIWIIIIVIFPYA